MSSRRPQDAPGQGTSADAPPVRTSPGAADDVDMEKVETRIGNRRLSRGDVAPDFVLPDADGRSVSSATFRGSSTVLYFFPAAGTPGCTTQADDFEAAAERLQAAGYRVVGVSPDETPVLERFRADRGLSFPLLSDPTHAVSEAYGAWGDKTSYGRPSTGLLRSTVVVDEHGRVAHVFSNVKATGHVDRLLRDLEVPPL